MCVCARARVRVHTCARECVLDSDQTCNLELICQLNLRYQQELKQQLHVVPVRPGNSGLDPSQVDCMSLHFEADPFHGACCSNPKSTLNDI
jgi:hypothetical protein